MSEYKETIADIVAWIRRHASVYGYDLADRIEAAYNRLAILTPEQWAQVAQQAGEIDDLKRDNARLRAALAKISAVTTRHYAARDLGDKGRRAIAEIMSACRFPDGALDEYERAFAENDLLRAAMNSKTEEPAK